MKNKLIILMFALLYLFSFKTEPVDDAVDTFSGASTPTFEPQIIDAVAGATEDEDDEDDEEDEEEDDE